VSASFDGGDQVGYVVGHKAATVAIAKAKEADVGAAGASNTWMTGMFSYYMEMATREGLAAMAPPTPPRRCRAARTRYWAATRARDWRSSSSYWG
jgi:LDH2 family malate/lactate/ureidoglycolate dehydrogenase